MKIQRPVDAKSAWSVIIGDNLPCEQKLYVTARLAGWAAGMAARVKFDKSAFKEIESVLSNEKTTREANLICKEILRINNGGPDLVSV